MPGRSSPPSGRSAIAEPSTAADLAEGLSPLARLALAYAPAGAREHWLTLLALDARLEKIVRTAREPMLAQLKLAWWRDRLSADPAGWPKGEPLLARLAGWSDPVALVALVDGWEELLGEPPVDAAAFAAGRAAAATALARELGADGVGVEPVARAWALADLVLAGEGIIPEVPPRGLPRAMRPLAVLAGVTLRAARKGSGDALYTPGAWLRAVRIGLFGR